MAFRATSEEALAAYLRDHHDRGAAADAIDITSMDRIVEHVADDMTVTVGAGRMVAALQSALREQHQWLPMDPPGADAVTVRELVEWDAFGSRRLGYGRVREHLIGVRVALADGEIIRSGGRVVKNVAGFDLCKLFVGSRGTLGIVVEATFKLLPIPKMERFWVQDVDSIDSACALYQELRRLTLAPIVSDLMRNPGDGSLTWAIGLAGAEADVSYQASGLETLGFAATDERPPERWWRDVDRGSFRKVALLPSRCLDALRGAAFDGVPFLAMVGSGVIWGPQSAAPALGEGGVSMLMERMKTAFDSQGVLPSLADQFER